jgi:hypothetical protein
MFEVGHAWCRVFKDGRTNTHEEISGQLAIYNE